MSSSSSSTHEVPLHAARWLLVAASLATFWVSTLVARYELLTTAFGVGVGRVLTYLGYLVIAVTSLTLLVTRGGVTREQAGVKVSAEDLKPVVIYSALVAAVVAAWFVGWVEWGARLGPEQLRYARAAMREIATAGLQNGIGSSMVSVWTTAVLATIIGAFAEEIIYRGMLQTVVGARLGNVVAVAVSTTTFAAAHALVYGYSYSGWPKSLVLMGALLGFLFVRHRSLLVVTSVHVVWNLALLVTANVLARRS